MVVRTLSCTTVAVMMCRDVAGNGEAGRHYLLAVLVVLAPPVT